MPKKDNSLNIWVVTDGKAGMENQALGLAEAMLRSYGRGDITVKRIALRSPWKELSPWLPWGLKWAASPAGDVITPPWPRVVIGTGRQSIPVVLYLKSQGCMAVQLQDPVISPKVFDYVVVPQHDDLRGSNVIVTQGALHRLTPEKLQHEAAVFSGRWAHLPRPYFGVMLGGPNGVYQLGAPEIQQLAGQLKILVSRMGGSLLITPSRRTGAENIQLLQTLLNDTPHYMWAMQDDNPYYGLLGAADYLLPTCDSVNMVSEAASTGKPVFMIGLPGGSAKFRSFHDIMQETGRVRLFLGEVEPYTYAPLDDISCVAQHICGALQIGSE